MTGCFDTDLTGDVRGVEEMFVPLDEEGEVVSARERKVRREREMRVARGKVREAVKGWERMFDGGKGGKYFWVGRVVGGEKEWEGTERRELCESAQKGRKRRGEGEKGREGVKRAEEV